MKEGKKANMNFEKFGKMIKKFKKALIFGKKCGKIIRYEKYTRSRIARRLPFLPGVFA